MKAQEIKLFIQKPENLKFDYLSRTQNFDLNEITT